MTERAAARRREDIRVNVIVVAFVFVVLAIPFVGAWIQANASVLNDCHQSIDDSLGVTEGHASTRWLPPSLHCSYDTYSGDAAYAAELGHPIRSSENRLAIAGTFVAALLAVPLLLLFAWSTKLVARGFGASRSRKLDRTAAAP